MVNVLVALQDKTLRLLTVQLASTFHVMSSVTKTASTIQISTMNANALVQALAISVSHVPQVRISNQINLTQGQTIQGQTFASAESGTCIDIGEVTCEYTCSQGCTQQYGDCKCISDQCITCPAGKRFEQTLSSSS